MSQPPITDSNIDMSRRMDDVSLRTVEIDQMVKETVEEAKRGDVSYDEPRLDHAGDDSFDFKLGTITAE